MCLSLYTKVTQQMQHFCIKNVACKDTFGAKRYSLSVTSDLLIPILWLVGFRNLNPTYNRINCKKLVRGAKSPFVSPPVGGTEGGVGDLGG